MGDSVSVVMDRIAAVPAPVQDPSPVPSGWFRVVRPSDEVERRGQAMDEEEEQGMDVKGTTLI